jgi:ferrous iron transport protein B
MFSGETPPFVLELPNYRWPSVRMVFGRVYDCSKEFVVRAGTLIFCASILIWAAGYFPGDHAQLYGIQTELRQLDSAASDSVRRQELLQQERQVRAELLTQSFLGRAGKAIEPLVKPLGWDWKIGVGVIGSFPAREVVIATLGTIYSLGGDVDPDQQGLIGSMRSATWPDGTPVYNVPVALSVMVFFALCAQCASTLMVIKRETRSWIWPLFTFSYMTLLAYVGALVVYQVGMMFG